MRAQALTIILCLAMGASSAGTVVIDTGHSQRSPGVTASDGTPEFELNRAMAVAIINSLEREGHDVIDVHALGLNRSLRGRTVKTKGADLFLSVHHDSIQQFLIDEGKAVDFSGFSVFISGKSRELQGTLRCAIHVGDAMVHAGEKPSRYHAAHIKGENRPLLDDRRGIHRYDHLAVLKAAHSPALLLEVGVAVNPYEIGKLQDPAWVTRVADQVASGISRCVPQPGTSGE